MDKKSTLELRLKKYTALAGGVTLAVAGTGQVVYTDINPDSVSTGNGASHSIDFDGDGNVDVTLSMVAQNQTGSFSYGTGMVSYGLDYGVVQAVVGTGANSGWMASNSAVANVAAGAAIGGAGSFSGGSGMVGYQVNITYGAPLSAYNTSYGGGNFVDSTDAYIGVKFDAAGAAHYGWVRIDLSADALTLTVKDYAYEATPGDPIIADAATISDVSELENFASIVSANNKVVISLINGTTKADATITSVSGQQVYSQAINSDREEIALKEFASGIYLVNVISDSGVVTKRVYVK